MIATKGWKLTGDFMHLFKHQFTYTPIVSGVLDTTLMWMWIDVQKMQGTKSHSQRSFNFSVQ